MSLKALASHLESESTEVEVSRSQWKASRFLSLLPHCCFRRQQVRMTKSSSLQNLCKKIVFPLSSKHFKIGFMSIIYCLHKLHQSHNSWLLVRPWGLYETMPQSVEWLMFIHVQSAGLLHFSNVVGNKYTPTITTRINQ